MNAPIVWIISPAIISLSLLIIQDKRIRSLFNIAISIVFVFLTFIIRIDLTGMSRLFTIDISSTMVVLGRSFSLLNEDIFLIQFVYLFNAIWGIAQFSIDKPARMNSLGLLFSAFLLSAVSVEPFLYSAFIIEVAIILSIPLLIHPQAVLYKGITRYLVYQTLSMPFILLAGWFLAGGEITPVNPEQLVQATLLLGLGFLFWLAIFPFHSWVPVVFNETEPINSGYIFILLLSIFFILILKFINGFAWLREFTIFFDALRFLGIITAVFGSIGLFFQNNFRKLLGFEFIHSIGIMLLSIGLSTIRGVILFTWILGSRMIAFSLLCWSVSSLEIDEDNRAISVFDFTAQGKPVAAVCVILSLLSLAGMPLTIGFPPIQTLYQYLATIDKVILFLLILSNTFISIKVFQLLKNILKVELKKMVIIESIKNEIFLFTFSLIFIISGFFPNFFLSPFEDLIFAYEFLIK